MEAFQNNYKEVERLLHLYEELVSERQKKLRSELKRSFRHALHLPQTVELDAAHKKGDWKYYVIVNLSKGGNTALFSHGGLAVLLRQAVALAVACMDGFFRDKYKEVVCDCVRSAIDSKSRLGLWDEMFPFSVIVDLEQYEKLGFWQRSLLNWYADTLTFQSPEHIQRAFKKIGITSLWESIRKGLPPEAKTYYGHEVDLKRSIQDITDRRNLIVHYADRTGARVKPIRPDDVTRWVDLIRSVVESADKAIREAFERTRAGTASPSRRTQSGTP